MQPTGCLAFSMALCVHNAIAQDTLSTSRRLSSSDAVQRVEALTELLAQGGATRDLLPRVKEACSDADGSVRILARAVLVRSRVDTQKNLVYLLEGIRADDVGVRQFSAVALGRIAFCSDATIDALIGALRDPDRDVRCQTIQSLAIVGPDASTPDAIVTALQASLRDPVMQNQIAAHCTLACMGHGVDSHVRALVSALEDDDFSIRWNAAIGLGQIGGPAANACPVLAKALEDRNWSIRGHAARALGQIGRPAVPYLPALQQAVGAEENPQASAAMREAIQQLARLQQDGLGETTHAELDQSAEQAANPERKKRESQRRMHSQGNQPTRTSAHSGVAHDTERAGPSRRVHGTRIAFDVPDGFTVLPEDEAELLKKIVLHTGNEHAEAYGVAPIPSDGVSDFYVLRREDSIDVIILYVGVRPSTTDGHQLSYDELYHLQKTKVDWGISQTGGTLVDYCRTTSNQWKAIKSVMRNDGVFFGSWTLFPTGLPEEAIAVDVVSRDMDALSHASNVLLGSLRLAMDEGGGSR